jgi:hypothetical protein
MPQGWSEAGGEIFVVTWEETVDSEEGEEEESFGEETSTDVWLFNSKAEMERFVAEEILERVELNRDAFPPEHVSDIREALAAGRILPADEGDEGEDESAVEMWERGTEEYFDLPSDVITITTGSFMERR